MTSLLVLVALGQVASSVRVCDPTTQSSCVTTSAAGAKRALDANILGGSLYVLDAGVLNVQGPLTDTQLRAAPVPVSGTVGVTEPVSIDDNGASITVDGTVGLSAGTNNIGDVDVLTVPAPLSTTGGGTEATALRVTVATDSTGVLSVDDNGGSLTVDGTVASTQSGTWTVQPGNTANTTPWLTTDTPRQVASANNPGTCVSVSTSSTTVLASNASRRAYAIKASEANTDRVYCKLGATATTSNMPFSAGSAWSQDTGAVYTGIIDCIAGSGTQTVCPFEVH